MLLKWRHGACSAELTTWRQAPCRLPALVTQVRARFRLAGMTCAPHGSFAPVLGRGPRSVAAPRFRSLRLRFSRCHAGCFVAASRRQPARQRTLDGEGAKLWSSGDPHSLLAKYSADLELSSERFDDFAQRGDMVIFTPLDARDF